MNIDKKSYIKLNIKENLFFYFLKDDDLNKELILNKKLLMNLVNKIYDKFLIYLSEKYNKKCVNNIEDYIYYEINIENILFNIIEDIIF